jgi:hypothetical protein
LSCLFFGNFPEEIKIMHKDLELVKWEDGVADFINLKEKSFLSGGEEREGGLRVSAYGVLLRYEKTKKAGIYRLEDGALSEAKPA